MFDSIDRTGREPTSGVPQLVLHFRGPKLYTSEFRPSAGRAAVLASTTIGGRYELVRWGAQLKSLAVFLLQQYAWYRDDPQAAAAEIDAAIAMGRDAPATAPDFAGPPRSAPATLAEALKAKRSNSIKFIFGDWDFLDLAFGKRVMPASVWLNVRQLSPASFRVTLDGRECSDPRTLRTIAAVIVEDSRSGAAGAAESVISRATG